MYGDFLSNDVAPALNVRPQAGGLKGNNCKASLSSILKKEKNGDTLLPIRTSCGGVGSSGDQGIIRRPESSSDARATLDA